MSKHSATKLESRDRRRARIRSRITGNSVRPRLSVFRSNVSIAAQVIDDAKGITLVSVNSRELKGKVTKLVAATEVGKLIASKAKAKGIEAVVFDRGGFLYHGRIKALAEAAREGGLTF